MTSGAARAAVIDVHAHVVLGETFGAAGPLGPEMGGQDGDAPWFRVGGYVPFSEDPVGNLRVMLLPGLTLSVFGIALILRTTRDAVMQVMTEGYITTAVARGERPRDIVRLHVLRNAAIPVVTVVTIAHSNRQNAQ